MSVNEPREFKPLKCEEWKENQRLIRKILSVDDLFCTAANQAISSHTTEHPKHSIWSSTSMRPISNYIIIMIIMMMIFICVPPSHTNTRIRYFHFRELNARSDWHVCTLCEFDTTDTCEECATQMKIEREKMWAEEQEKFKFVLNRVKLSLTLPQTLFTISFLWNSVCSILGSSNNCRRRHRRQSGIITTRLEYDWLVVTRPTKSHPLSRKYRI